MQRHDASATFRTGDLVWLSPRAESIELAPLAGETNSINKIHGKISAAAYQGAFVEYEVAAAGTILNAHVIDSKRIALPQPGEEVTLGFAPETMQCLVQPGNE